MQEMDGLYAGLYSDAVKEFRDLYCVRYLEVLRWLGKEEPDEDFLDELVDMWLAGFLNEPSEVVQYAFQPELIRKRDRAKEAVDSVPTKTEKQIVMDKNVKYVIHQDAYFTDIASQEAEIQALKDAGVKWVQRHEMNDEKTCTPCREADGRVYRIENAPAPEHPRCRLWFTPFEK